MSPQTWHSLAGLLSFLSGKMFLRIFIMKTCHTFGQAHKLPLLFMLDSACPAQVTQNLCLAGDPERAVSYRGQQNS